MLSHHVPRPTPHGAQARSQALASVRFLLFFSLLAMVMMATAEWAAATTQKITICHFPPGNTANFQTITISPSALPAHLAHHDFGGPCENDCALFGSICDDGNECTVDTCNADGTCANSAPTNCDDGNPCTADSCNTATGACVNTPVSTSTTCSDGNACTGPVDHCDSTGQCHGAAIPGCCTTDGACNDQNPCTIDACNLASHTCTNVAKTCTPSDLCHRASCAPDDGSCVEAPIDCDDQNACTDDSCNPGTGACEHTGSCGLSTGCTSVNAGAFDFSGNFSSGSPIGVIRDPFTFNVGETVHTTLTVTSANGGGGSWNLSTTPGNSNQLGVLIALNTIVSGSYTFTGAGDLTVYEVIGAGNGATSGTITVTATCIAAP